MLAVSLFFNSLLMGTLKERRRKGGLHWTGVEIHDASTHVKFEIGMQGLFTYSLSH